MIFQKYDKILFAGDSVTDMGSRQPVGQDGGDSLGVGYVRVFDTFMATSYPEMPIGVMNAGISGDRTRELLNRFEQHVMEMEPDWLSIGIGINDVWRQFDNPAMLHQHVLPDEYRDNLEKMILRAKPEVKGIFILSPYIIEPNEKDAMRARMDEYVEICRELSEKHGCIFVNLQEMFAEYCKHHHPSYIAWDRIHPNQIGAMLIAKEILKHCEFEF